MVHPGRNGVGLQFGQEFCYGEAYNCVDCRILVSSKRKRGCLDRTRSGTAKLLVVDKAPQVWLPSLSMVKVVSAEGPEESAVQRIGTKPVHWVKSSPFNAHSGFVHKRLCSGPTFTAGTSCVYSCRYCYVQSIVLKQQAVRDILKRSGKRFDQVVIRREAPLQRLAEDLTCKASAADGDMPTAESCLTPELINKWGLVDEWSLAGRVPRFRGQEFAEKVIFGSPLVEIAASPALADETVELGEILLRLTSYQLRLLSKSPLLKDVAEELASRHPDAKTRVVFGLSTGTLDDSVAKAIEYGAPPPSLRLKALHWLQDKGFRTFGMICPVLPYEDPRQYAAQVMKSIRAEKCEEVWAEAFNLRARGNADQSTSETEHNSFQETWKALKDGGHADAAQRFKKVADDNQAWEQYSRTTFEAFSDAVPKREDGQTKLRWLQYPRTEDDIPAYWDAQQDKGVLLLGAAVTNFRFRPFKFNEADVNGPALAERLQAAADPVSKLVWGKLPRAKRAILETSGAPDKKLAALVAGLNGIMKGPLKMADEVRCSIYDEKLFAEVPLSPETERLLARRENAAEWELVQLNRHLLDDAFAQAREKGESRSAGERLEIIEPVRPLSADEAAQLKECESVIGRGFETFLEVGGALATIRDNRLYRDRYGTFQEYCRRKWEFSKSHANRLIGASKVNAVLAPIGAKITSESQVRPLLGLELTQVPTIWKKAEELAGDGEVTAKTVKRAVHDSQPTSFTGSENAPVKKSVVKRVVLTSALKLLDKAEKAAKNHDTAAVMKTLSDLRKCLLEYGETA